MWKIGYGEKDNSQQNKIEFSKTNKKNWEALKKVEEKQPYKG